MTVRKKLSQLPVAQPLAGGEVIPLVLNGATVIATAAAVAALHGPRGTHAATTDPGSENDAGQGYAVGSLWFNAATGVTWRCREATVGAAVWVAQQPRNANLTALADLTGTGLCERTGSGTAAVRPIGTQSSNAVPTRADADARYAQLTGASFQGNLGVGAATPNLGGWGRALTVEATTSTGFEIASTRTDGDGATIGALDVWYNTNISGHRRLGAMICLSDGTTANQRGGAWRFYTKPNGQSAIVERMRIAADGTVTIGNFALKGAEVTVNGAGVFYRQSGTASDNIQEWRSDYGSTGELKGAIDADGTPRFDNALASPAADYADMFESADGQAIPVGTCVVLEGEKIRPATADDPADAIIGVIRPPERCTVLGNQAWREWQGKWRRDVFGRRIMEPVPMVRWTESVTRTERRPVTRPVTRVVERERIEIVDGLARRIVEPVSVTEEEPVFELLPLVDGAGAPLLDAEGNPRVHREPAFADIEVPDGTVERVCEVARLDGRTPPPEAEYFTVQRAVLSADFDPSFTYVPRIERPEWCAVGLVGIVEIIRGQPVGDRWRKLRDIDADIEQWLIR